MEGWEREGGLGKFEKRVRSKRRGGEVGQGAWVCRRCTKSLIVRLLRLLSSLPPTSLLPFSKSVFPLCSKKRTFLCVCVCKFVSVCVRDRVEEVPACPVTVRGSCGTESRQHKLLKVTLPVWGHWIGSTFHLIVLVSYRQRCGSTLMRLLRETNLGVLMVPTSRKYTQEAAASVIILWNSAEDFWIVNRDVTALSILLLCWATKVPCHHGHMTVSQKIFSRRRARWK